MNDLSRQHHWEKVYTTRGESEVSWFQETPALSLELIGSSGQCQTPPSSTLAAAPHASWTTWFREAIRI